MKPTVESIWNEFSSKLGQFIAARVADSATAEDILQDVFLKIQTRLGRIIDCKPRTKDACQERA